MGRINLYAGWVNGYTKMCNIDIDLTVEIYVDKTPLDPVPNGVYRIIKILEPFEYVKETMFDYLRNNRNCYNYILTYYQEILDEFENSLLSCTPTTWVHEYDFPHKDFGVSALVGNKHNSSWIPQMGGYLLRWEIYERADLIEIPKRFFMSSHAPILGLDHPDEFILKESKNPLFDAQFHITIENTDQIKNAFSEKLIDCFRTKTVPIYYGASNIGEFFNLDGIFCANNVEEIIEICNKLNPDTYNSMIEAIEDNYNRAMDYSYFNISIVDQTKKILKLI